MHHDDLAPMPPERAKAFAETMQPIVRMVNKLSDSSLSELFQLADRVNTVATNFVRDRDRRPGQRPGQGRVDAGATEDDCKLLASDLANRTRARWRETSEAIAQTALFIGPGDGSVTFAVKLDTNAAGAATTARLATSAIDDATRRRQAGEALDRLDEFVRGHCEYHWPNVLHEWRTSNAARLGAIRALEYLAKAGDECADAGDPGIAARLASAVRREIDTEGFRLAIGWPLQFEPVAEEVNEMVWQFGRTLEYLRSRPALANSSKLDKFESAFREELRQWHSQGDLADAWTNTPWHKATPAVVAGVVAVVLWDVEVRPSLERERRDANTVVTLSLPVAQGLIEMMGRDNEVQRRDGRAVIVNATGQPVAEVPVVDIDDLAAIQRGGELLRSVTGQALVRHVVVESFRLHQRSPNAVDLFYDGGISDLAERIGAKRDEIHAILLAGQRFHRRWVTGQEIAGLWIFCLAKAESLGRGRGRHHRLTLTPGYPLRPYFSEKYLKPGERFGRPVLPMPVRVGKRRNEWASQALFQDEVTGEMVRNRVELYRDGGVILDETTLVRLAENAGLRGSKPWEPLLECWTRDADAGPAMLELRDGRYNLSEREPYRAARQWLMRGGEVSAKGRAAQQQKRATSGRKPAGR